MEGRRKTYKNGLLLRLLKLPCRAGEGCPHNPPPPGLGLTWVRECVCLTCNFGRCASVPVTWEQKEGRSFPKIDVSQGEEKPLPQVCPSPRQPAPAPLPNTAQM